MIFASCEDFRRAAQRRLPRFLFDYLDGGADRETTLGRNTRDLQDVALEQRVLRDVSRIDLGTTLFGARQALPLILGPVGISGMCARRGEVQAARAACGAGIPFTLSTVSICSVEEVAQSWPAPKRRKPLRWCSPSTCQCLASVTAMRIRECQGASARRGEFCSRSASHAGHGTWAC